MGAYYKDLSDVTVTFDDGEVKTYRITAGVSISTYLAQEASRTGILNLWNKEQSICIPVTRVREWSLASVPIPEGETNG